MHASDSGALCGIGLLGRDSAGRLTGGTMTHRCKLFLDVLVRFRVDGGLVRRGGNGISAVSRTDSLAGMTWSLGYSVEGVGLMGSGWLRSRRQI